jgi:hypothetical protein
MERRKKSSVYSTSISVNTVTPLCSRRYMQGGTKCSTITQWNVAESECGWLHINKQPDCNKNEAGKSCLISIQASYFKGRHYLLFSVVLHLE